MKPSYFHPAYVTFCAAASTTAATDTAATTTAVEHEKVMPVAAYMLSRGGFTRERTMANIAELLLGGVDTTSNALLWTVYELSRNPQVCVSV